MLLPDERIDTYLLLSLGARRGKESLLNRGLALLLDNKERGKHVALAWSR